MLPKLLILLLAYPLAHSSDPHVLKLTDANFSKQTSINENLLIMFYLPWSGQCQKLRPLYAYAAKILKINEIPVTLAKMDCSNEGRLTCEGKNLKHKFPALHFYKKGHFVKEYTGPRETMGIVKFMRVQASPNIVQLKTVEEFKEFLGRQNDVAVVGFFEDESRLKRMFMKVFEEMRELIVFAYTTCEKLFFKEGVFNGIVLYRPESLLNRYEEERSLFHGRVNIGEMKNFIVKNYHGLVGLRNSMNRSDFQNPLIVLYYTVDRRNSGKEANYWRARMFKVAHKYKNVVRFAVSTKDNFEEELAPYDVDFTNSMKPFVLGIDLENQKYVMEANFSAETFDKFVDDFVHRRLQPCAMSKDLHSDIIISADADTFDQLVMHDTKDVLLCLYDPRIIRHHKYIPVLREVTNLLQDEDVQVVRMDITQNEVPKMFKNMTVPNIFWLSRYKKWRPVEYPGGRSVNDFIRFVAREATQELRRYDRGGDPKHDEL